MEQTLVDAFEAQRPRLTRLAYRMLGSVADAQDAVQDAWLRWARGGGEAADPAAWLVRTVTRLCIDRLRAAKAQRDAYRGPWLPDPLVEPLSVDPVERAEDVSVAFLLALERLSPLERAVFVLHEVFGYQLAEIADIIGRTPAAVRQLAHRAREHVQARRPRFAADPQVQLEVTQRFVDAIVGADLTALMEVLAPDVTLWADGGGKARAAGLQPILGRDRIAPLIIGDRVRRPVPSLDVQYRTVNGDPSALLLTGDTPFAVIVLEVEGDQVTAIYAITNPDKLAHVEVR
jgi:RNA polymerase sigma-70 factor (ECF subfamily)